MNLQEIKTAVDAGKKVHWREEAYTVIKNQKNGDYLIQCSMNKHCIGLTWADGETMNGREQDFFIAEPQTEGQQSIQITDIKEGAKFKTQSGIVWIIDSIEGDKVRTSFEHGSKGNYKDPISEVVSFLNEEKATKL